MSLIFFQSLWLVFSFILSVLYRKWLWHLLASCSQAVSRFTGFISTLSTERLSTAVLSAPFFTHTLPNISLYLLLLLCSIQLSRTSSVLFFIITRTVIMDTSFGQLTTTANSRYGLIYKDLPGLIENVYTATMDLTFHYYLWLGIGSSPSLSLVHNDDLPHSELWAQYDCLFGPFKCLLPLLEVLSDRYGTDNTVNDNIMDHYLPLIEDMISTILFQKIPWLAHLHLPPPPPPAQDTILTHKLQLRYLHSLFKRPCFFLKLVPQGQAIKVVCHRHPHLLIVLCTGGGKSTVYQAPSFAKESGFHLVIIPYNSLMEQALSTCQQKVYLIALGPLCLQTSTFFGLSWSSQLLNILPWTIFIHGLWEPISHLNIQFIVLSQPESSLQDFALHIINHHTFPSPPDHSIIFCEIVEDAMVLAGHIKAPLYVGHMNAQAQFQAVKIWLSGGSRWLCATLGFAQGIDYSHVSYVIRYQIPKHMTLHTQQSSWLTCHKGTVGVSHLIYSNVPPHLCSFNVDFRGFNAMLDFATKAQSWQILIINFLNSSPSNCHMLGPCELCNFCCCHRVCLFPISHSLLTPI